MASLSSLVAARGVATMAEVEEAITRQVLHGGDLVTSLLELLDRSREPALTGVLAEHLAIAPTFSPLPPASPELARLLPADVARRHTIYPISYTQRSLTVAVSELLPEEAAGDLSFMLGRSIVQAAAPTVRIREALARDYGFALDRRFLRLLARLDGQRDPSPSSLPPPRRRRTEDGPLPHVPGAPAVPAVSTVFGTFRRATLAGFALPHHAAPPPPPVTDRDATSPSLLSRPTPPEAPVAKRSERPPSPSSLPPPAVRIPPHPAPANIDLAWSPRRLAEPVVEPAVEPLGEPRLAADTLVDAVVSPTVTLTAALVPARPREVMSWARTAIVHGKSTRKRRRGPMSVAEAEAALAETTEASDALDVFFDFVQQFFQYSALFFIQGDVAGGRDAYGPGADRHRVNGIGIPLDLPSCFAHVRRTGAPFAGVANREGIEAEVVNDLQRPAGVGFLLIPVAVRGRCVAFLYADEGGEEIELQSAGEPLGFSGLLARALERIAVEKKKQRQRGSIPPPRAAMAADVSPSELPTREPDSVSTPPPPVASIPGPPAFLALSDVRGQLSAQQLAAREMSARYSSLPPPVAATAAFSAQTTPSVAPPPVPADPPEELPEPVLSPSPTTNLEWSRPRATPPSERPRARLDSVPRSGPLTPEQSDLLRALLSPDARVGEVLPLVVRQGASMVSALVAALPGPTDVPRASVMAGDARPSHTGPLFRALVALRRVALPHVIAASASGDPAFRFFSTFLLGELPFEGSADAIAARLFDADPDVQRIAVVAARLLGPTRPVAAPVLRRLEEAVQNADESPSRRRRAAAVLGQLHVRSAVPALLAQRSGALALPAGQALVEITCQDFGDDAAAWQAWWERSQTKHRVEWLIDALVHREPDLRVRAAEELRTLAPRSGLSRVATATREELEELHRRYLAWWRESGHAEAAALDE